MPLTNKTGQLTVTLHEEVLEALRARIASGEYENESDIVEAALLDLLLPPILQGPSDEWLRNEVVPVLDAMNADPSRGRTPEDVLARLRDRHVRRVEC